MSHGAANLPRPPAGMVCVGYRPVTGDPKDDEGRPFLHYDYAPAKPPRKPAAASARPGQPKPRNSGSM